ncbi:hypothetical protein CDAR_165131 [Caerostris darwini]|uniref:DNA-directed RNA polymerase subunit n=1 Tax=Caerostris darwini TaxID=1538125 RepID=A0AAV4NWN7_9ARAC|nr:hypothetical protein CDAR_165131 [Caerostris darwini]
MEVASTNIKELSFGLFSTEEIKKLSVLEIDKVEFWDLLGNAASGGLYDLCLGPNDQNDVCQTCGLGYIHCSGHSGHINLPVTVYNPFFFKELYKLLRGTCFKCYRILAPIIVLHLVSYQLQALDYGLVNTVQDLQEIVTEEVRATSKEESISKILNKLEKKFKDAVNEAQHCNQSQCPVKSVVEHRKKIVRAFSKKYLMNAIGKCPHCESPKKKITRYNARFVFRDSAKSVASASSTRDFANKDLMPEDARKLLQFLWKNDNNFLSQFYRFLKSNNPNPVDVFFMDAILVPPSRFRKSNVFMDVKKVDQTTLFKEILQSSILLKKLMKKMDKIQLTITDEEVISKCTGKNLNEKYNNAYHQLQKNVNVLFDSESHKDRNRISEGIRQILEKKEGLLRMNMMGKRVNYAARSVISPDPYIMVNEVGIPLIFAKKLTFPEPVTFHNVEKLQQAVINGPDVHPGAIFIEMEDGRKFKLTSDAVKRQAIANNLLIPHLQSSVKKKGKGMIVHRHIKNGDMVILNRQPTLHRLSMMAHKARILPGEKTLRLHYSNCKSYNADFDGDEMNCHLPQSYPGQGECFGIASVNHQYLVPKDGTPHGGLIQDHIVAGVLLTMRGRFFQKNRYQQLVWSAMSSYHKRLKLLPPAILKPQTLWSGKQIISTIILNLIPEGKIPLNLQGKSKVSQKNWKTHPAREWFAGGSPLKGESMSESEVVVREGELLCGVIDKAQVGPTPYSLIHMCYELYGGEVSNTILTALARLLSHYLQYYAGFSLGIEDIVVTEKANKKRRHILKKAKKEGLIATARALDVDNPDNPEMGELLYKYKEVHSRRDDFGLKVLDVEMKRIAHDLNNEINKICTNNSLTKKFPNNNLQLMVESGAKGSSVNAMQISYILGQIELEGRRMPLMLNGSTLPSFEPYDTSPQAGGFVAGRFLTGLNPQEYFFHCMAGREGLIDTAVKTSRSGYLQRCLIKHLEGLTVVADQTVRDSDGTVIQFQYGEDGMDPLKNQLLKPNSIHLLAMNYKALMSRKHVEVFKNMVDVDLNKEKKKIKREQKKHRDPTIHRSSLIMSVKYKSGDHGGRNKKIFAVLDELDEAEKTAFDETKKKCPDPVNSKYRPDVTFGSVTEKLDSLISDYVSKNPHNLLWNENLSRNKNANLSVENFKDLCYFHGMKSLAEPGDAVGLLAAQSIGEPSTQMTLNTFHFAGKGEMNVTLGIPRIREILMTASKNIATPTMDLPLLDQPRIKQKAAKLKLELCPVYLRDVIHVINIKEYLSVTKNMSPSRIYVIRMNFLRHSEYKKIINTSPSKILKYIEQSFVKKFIDVLKKKMSQSSKLSICVTMDESAPPKSEPTEVDEEDAAETEDEPREGGEESESEEGDKKQKQEYEDPEEEDLVPESDNDSEDQEAYVEGEDQEESSEIEAKEIKENKIDAEQKATRINNVISIHPDWLIDYDFDTVRERWCEIYLRLLLNENTIDMKSFVEEELNKAKIHSVQHINEAILVENPDAKEGCDLMLKTNGVNFLEIFKYVDVLDINKVYSNDIHAIADIYGIEAAVQVIKREIMKVFAAYGIQVDPRHLSLIADYMTCSGYYRPCNRIGMEGNASPLQQMTFETSKNFMTDAMVMGVKDNLVSPSANVVVGQMPKSGTGLFDLLYY